MHKAIFIFLSQPHHPGYTLYQFEDRGFSTIRDLLDYHIKSQIPVTKASGVILSETVSCTCSSCTRIDKWIIRCSDIKVGQKIAHGNFGKIFKAIIISTKRQVAIKTCRSILPVSEKHKFLQGAEMLKQLNNPNIVQLIGIVAENKQLYVIMEFMPGGSFLYFLKTSGRLHTNNHLTVMCTQVCAGMKYLEENNCIHCDLAARSCLVSSNNIVKIEGFGMIIEEGGTYIPPAGTQVSIKWTAPEVSIIIMSCTLLFIFVSHRLSTMVDTLVLVMCGALVF